MTLHEINQRQLFHNINHNGFIDGFSLSINELKFIKNVIYSDFCERIKNFDEKLTHEEDICSLKHYHLADFSKFHVPLWPKRHRMLNKEAISKLKSMNFFKSLFSMLNLKKIANADNIQEEEVYWRIVRPNCHDDIGSLHADSWFYTQNKVNPPKDIASLKLWIAIETDIGENGLCYIPGSHKVKYEYDLIDKKGMRKPLIRSCDAKHVVKFQASPGDTILFHDDFIHGGFIGGFNTRVSLEMALWVPASLIQSYINYN